MYHDTGDLVTFLPFYGTLVMKDLFEEAWAMRELSELVKAAQAGDSDAYATLIQRYQGLAYVIAYKYLGDHHLTQDLVQEAAIEAFVHLPKLEDPMAFPGWFRQIVFRQCMRMLRKNTLPFISLDDTSSSLFAEGEPEDSAMQTELQADVRSAIASLPRHEQLAAALFYGCGYSYNEISALLKIPLSTVKKRLYSARQRLKVQLQALHDEIENATRNEEEAEEAAIEISLANWWSWLFLRLGLDDIHLAA